MEPDSVVSAIRGSVLDRWTAGRYEHQLLLAAMRAFGATPSDLPALAEGLQEFTWKSRDAGLANALGIQLGLIYPLLAQVGPGRLKPNWIDGVKNQTLIGSFAVTERATGSAIRDFRTSITKVDSGYVLNGEKWMISLAPVAHLCVVVSRLVDDFALLLVDTAAPGVTVSPQRVHVIRTCPVGAIRFQDVVVDEAQVLACGGEAKRMLSRLVDIDRAFVWRYRVGRLRSILELLVAFGTRRLQAGRPLTEFQTFAFRIGDIRVALANCEALMRTAVIAVAQDAPDASLLAAIARLELGRQSVRAGSDMLHMLGSSGLSEGSLAWMYFADTRLDCIGGGATEVIQKQISQTTIRQFRTADGEESTLLGQG